MTNTYGGSSEEAGWHEPLEQKKRLLCLSVNGRTVFPNHAHRTNRAGRQMCCQVCHECGQTLRTVLDGELWCDHCLAYK